jgi:hypothetical protein
LGELDFLQILGATLAPGQEAEGSVSSGLRGGDVADRAAAEVSPNGIAPVERL